MAAGDVRPVVTLAALYGAGGSVVGPRVARRLGVPFFDREIVATVADRTGLPQHAVAEVDDEARSRTQRLLSNLGRASTISGGATNTPDPLDLQERRIRSSIEEAVAAINVSGGVVLGRGAMIVLRGSTAALHVNLRGSAEARLAQGMALEGVDRATARRRQEVEDRARIDYVRRAYGADGHDPALYHLVVDSTQLELDDCVELIVSASNARIRRSVDSPET